MQKGLLDQLRLPEKELGITAAQQVEKELGITAAQQVEKEQADRYLEYLEPLLEPGSIRTRQALQQGPTHKPEVRSA